MEFIYPAEPVKLASFIDQMIGEIERDHKDSALSKAEQNRAFNNEYYLDALLECRKINPVEFNGFVKILSDKSNLAEGVIKDQVKVHEQNRINEAREAAKKAKAEALKAAKGAPETDFEKSVREAATEIINRGKSYKYIYYVWQLRVKGNQYLGKQCIVSRGAQSCLNTKGIFVYANGKAGEGKSHGLSTMCYLLPPDRLIDGDVSLKNLYYDDSLIDAMTLHVDDLDLNDGLASLHKKITTKFQDGAEHRTVIEGASFKMKLPKRLAIWTSSVDMHGDE